MELTPSTCMRTYSRNKTIITGSILLLFLVGIWLMNKLTYSESVASNNTVNLLQSGWDYIPGATPTPHGVRVSYLGRSIVEQNGAPGQNNPPVNLYGTRLSATNDYTLSAVIQDIKGEASFRLYAAPPIIQDEFRVEPKSIDFRIKDSSLTISRWNGYRNENLRRQKPISSSTYAVTTQADNILTLQRSSNQLTISFNNKKIQTLVYDDVFTKNIWFGVSAVNPTDSWTLTRLDATSSQPNTVKVTDTQDIRIQRTNSDTAFQSMATSKRPGFMVGAATALGPSVGDNNYHALAYGGNFGMITTENALKWQFIHPQPELYDFKEADALVALAKQNSMRVQGHTLVFAEGNPKWVQDLPTATSTDREKVKQVMIDHITKTVSHFKGRVGAWDVVNEPMVNYDSEGGILRSHKWYQAMGEDYIATAFNAARQADPDAKLYINDYGLEEDGDRWDNMLALVTKLKKQGVPIDGIGFEGHVYEVDDEIDPWVLQSHIRALATIGIMSHISEMDVHDDSGTAAQAKQYADVLNMCIHEPSCMSWTTWGVSDKYNLSESDTQTLAYGHDFLWDERYAPTPAVTEIQRRLKE
ncbi:MAG: putative glycosyl hydrolase [Candidatus Saccharibacteria bacterium]|nr:putative glycosyl hydrolase [Candidatus Saccharibacteria bacterium]